MGHFAQKQRGRSNVIQNGTKQKKCGDWNSCGETSAVATGIGLSSSIFITTISNSALTIESFLFVVSKIKYERGENVR